MSARHSDLIYDVGLFDGADTAYYLFRGYRVVAIDANPIMVDRAAKRFAKEVSDKRLILLNVGISDSSGDQNFWVSERAEWSSFDRSIASRDGTPHKSISVKMTPFEDILREYGVPKYLKIDIEGKDRVCINALRNSVLPQFISAEDQGPGDTPDEIAEGIPPTLKLLHDVGYRRFKLVSQYQLHPARGRIARFAMRCVHSAAYGRAKVKGISSIFERFSDAASLDRMGFTFVMGSSGPWGDDISCGWMSFSAARKVYLEERRLFSMKQGAAPYAFWYDWHATL